MSDAIEINEQSLTEWCSVVDETVGRVTEETSFSGVAMSTVTQIDVPEDILTSASYANNHPVLFKNGTLVDPRQTMFNAERNKILLLNGLNLRRNDTFIIMIQRIDVVVMDTVTVA